MSLSNKPTEIALLLKSIFKDRGWRDRVDLHGVFGFWKDVVGKEVAEHAEPYLIRGTTLWVNVTDSVWMQQLVYEKTMILEQVNQRLDGKTDLTDIRFSLTDRLHSETPPEKLPERKKQPDKKRLTEIEQMLAMIDDEDMKKTMRRLWVRFETSGKE
ncbi:MAG: DUF721 domain-containing protein [Proteobacteria bacterium]|nr:DUF721 domain-containing protein [Pseudomonadota bacterium]MBU1710216.1 DUF721 domain-containing protein [Pseudomonadota bacterium]